jgi:very-short-patch-repair endonuclease
MGDMTTAEYLELMRQRNPEKPRAKRFEGTFSARKRKSRIETQFLLRWNGPAFVTEYRFHPMRKWRFDFAWPLEKVAMEVDGAIFGGKSGHNTGVGIARDAEKNNNAVELGWRLIRLTAKSNLDDEIRRLKELIAAPVTFAQWQEPGTTVTIQHAANPRKE